MFARRLWLLICLASAVSAKNIAIITEANSVRTTVHCFELAKVHTKINAVHQSKVFNFKLESGNLLTSRISQIMSYAKTCARNAADRQAAYFLLRWTDTGSASRGQPDFHIRKELQKQLKSNGFNRVIPKQMTILSADDKAQYMWYSYNQRKNIHEWKNVIYLGDNRALVTINSKNQEDAALLEVPSSSTLFNFGQTLSTTSHGYDRFGQKYALMRAVGALEACEKQNPSCNTAVFRSPCLPSNFQVTYQVEQYRFKLAGPRMMTSSNRYDSCKATVDAIVQEDMDNRIYAIPATIADSYDFVAIGKFYDDLKNVRKASIYPQDDYFVNFNLRNLKRATKIICSELSNKPEEAYSCFNLCYLHALLSKGFQFKDDKNLRAEKSEVNWPLGLAIGVHAIEVPKRQ